jgi:methylated-DNA-[protein]-cysteine S-methyltransferase
LVDVAVTHVVYEADGWGAGELVVADGQVVWHELPWPRRGRTRAPLPGAGGSRDPSQTPTHPGAEGVASVLPERSPPSERGFVTEVVRMLKSYFAGDAASELDEVAVDLEYDTPFFERCAVALRAVPRGEVVTYGELAALAGALGAARAAGSFCARNRLGLFVPCHRVVAADGLGSYGSYGIAYKRRLLELEGAL